MPETQSSSRYASERYAPIKACSSITKLTFDGTTLAFTTPGQTRFYTATTGKLGPVFTLAAQEDHGHGAIPEGHYWIDPAQLWTAGLGWRLLSVTPFSEYTDGWSFHRLTIHPFPDTQTYNRGGFFIHGGTHIGSAGCIHLIAGGMDSFLADLKQALGGLPECSILLDVTYPRSHH